ncbi:hypothetical protein HA397_29930, partial [Escherichia coli]|nr:hypothetical protein [Escherichia coli]
TPSLLEWPRLMIVAQYSYLQISSLVFAGIALGYWFAGQRDMKQAGQTLMVLGGFGMAILLVIGFEVYAGKSFASRSAPFFGGRMGMAFYFFFSALLFGAMLLMVRVWAGLPGLLRFGLQAVIVLGGLALPVYAFHGLVIPIKDILRILGLPGIAALGLPVAVFLAWLGYAWWRLR